MKCEQVEELLSAYLDGKLALGEATTVAADLQQDITDHLRGCVQCSMLLAEYRYFDGLLAELPRVSPEPALRLKLFSSPEYLELTGTYGAPGTGSGARTVPSRAIRYTIPGRPTLVALPGGRGSSSVAPTTPRLPASHPAQPVTRPALKRRNTTSWGVRALQVALAAVVLVTLGIGGFVGWNLWQGLSAAPQATTNAITPPAGMPERVPLSVGVRYVFWLDGALWSAPATGDAAAQQLTPAGVEVADGWAVSSPMPGRTAGDMLAYIDAQQARVHIVRSDGLNDTVISQPLLKPGSDPTSIWDTAAGTAILNSLTWSNDGTMLAFVADPQGTGATSLYIYSVQSNNVQHVPLPAQGSVSQPAWSPDGWRIAFVQTHHGMQSIVDYNIQNRAELTIDGHAASTAYPGDSVLSLNWSPSTASPAISWSVGVIGHVHGIWQQHIGSGWTPTPQALITGDYVQAMYSAAGHGGMGSWLLVASIAGRAADLWQIDLIPGAPPVQLTQGRQVAVAQWSPDGSAVYYLDSLSDGVGALHVVNTTSAKDVLLNASVIDDPAPAWSVDGRQLAYSTGTQTVVVSVTGSTPAYALPLHGHVNALVWLPGEPRQLMLSMSDGPQGLYLVDTERHTLRQIDQQTLNGAVLWTEVP